MVGGTAADLTFRGRHQGRGTPVLVQMYRSKWPTERDLALITADPGGPSLAAWLAARTQPDIVAAVRIAGGLAEAIGRIHENGVVHNSVVPAWLHVEPGDGNVAVGGFARASRLRSEAAAAAAPGASLHYMSPEQTGRMNRPVDARSDLYALGVIFFELLTGELPFKEDDPLALVHAHIARPAPSVTDFDPSIPAPLAEMVATLLNKNADDRYATARGLAADLRLAVEALGQGEPLDFELRANDISDVLTLPQALYGREEELAKLGYAFTEALAGRRNALFVAGYSGIGKSQLISEVEPSIVKQSGWFGGGKFDLYRRDIPYIGWTGVVTDLVHQALTLHEERLAALQTELQARLGGNAAALTEVVPELASLVGDSPPLPEATPAEAQGRFDQAFRNFIRTLASAENPLVLFLDDLQWADLASLRLLEAVLADNSAHHLLVLGAWRDNEVGPDHPLLATLRHLEEAAVDTDVLELGPLPRQAVEAFLADAVQRQVAAVADLAGLVEAKTNGNPFFMRQFLEELVRDGLIDFDSERAAWTWDVAAAETRQITDNVADLMSHRVATLPEAVTHVVGLASCVGSTFGLQAVAEIADLPAAETARALDRAMAEGLILPLDDTYRYATAETAAADRGQDAGVDTNYAFSHDRVHEAAHDSLEAAERAQVHLTLAQQMIAAVEGPEGLDDRAILVASHLSEGRHLLDDPAERVRAADVFLQAGSRAKVTMATTAARGFLENGLELLPDNAWDDHYDLALALHTQAADVAYIEQRFDDIDRYAPQVLEHARSVLDRVPIHNIRIGVGVAKRAYRDATVYAVDVLEHDFGISLPKDPTKLHVLKGVAQVKMALRGHTTHDLLGLPPMTNPEAQAVMGILMKTATNAYWATPNLVPLIAFEMCRLSVEHGNIGLSAYGYALYGMITSAALGQVDLGYDFGRLAMDLLDQTGDTHLIGKTALLWHGFIRHSKDPMRECGPDILAAYDVALDAGDIENAVYCGTVAFFTDVLAGRSVDWVRNRYAGYIEAMLASGQDQTIGALKAWLQCIDNLASDAEINPELTGEHVDFTVRLPELIAAESGTAIPNEVAAAGFLAFLLDDMVLAEKYLSISWERREDAPGQSFNSPAFAFYVATLTRKAARGEATAADRARILRVRRALATRAKNNPHDLEPFVGFLAAEEMRARRRPAAADRYLDVAAMARERGFAFLEGLALEEAAELHGSRGHVEVARQLLANARAVWQRYGALARLKLLAGEDTAAPEFGHDAAASTGALAGIDSRTLLDTVHAVSSEIELDKLTERVMTLAVQNAGAGGGVLVLKVDNDLHTAARAVVAESGAISVTKVDAESRPYPTAVVDYAARTGEPLLLDDASTEELFSQDPYVVGNKTRSVLCAPLLRSGELVGILYLENDLGIGVFTEQHLTMLQTIGGQAAVSLENARLFEQQRAQAEAFAHFVPRPFLEQLDRRSITDVVLGDAVEANLRPYETTAGSSTSSSVMP